MSVAVAENEPPAVAVILLLVEVSVVPMAILPAPPAVIVTALAAVVAELIAIDPYDDCSVRLSVIVSWWIIRPSSTALRNKAKKAGAVFCPALLYIVYFVIQIKNKER